MVCKKKVGKLKYVITSHPNYSRALECLLDSMYVAKIKPSDIIVILGDCDTSGKHIKEPIKMRPGVHYIPIENNLFEYNFFIGVMKAIKLGICSRIDDFFLLHDTCIVGDKFSVLTEAARKHPEQIIWNNKGGSFNIGLFKYSAVKEGYNFFKNIKTMNKHVAILAEHNRHHYSIKRFPVSQRYNVQARKQTIHYFYQKDIYSDNERKRRTGGYLQLFDLLKFFLWVPNFGYGDVHPNSIEEK